MDVRRRVRVIFVKSCYLVTSLLMIDEIELPGDLQNLTPIMPFSPLLSHLQRMQSLPKEALEAVPALIDKGPVKLPSWMTKDWIMGLLSGRYENFISEEESFLGKAERIYMMRYLDGSIEFLVKSKVSQFCKWVHETEFMQYKSFKELLEAFYVHPFDFEQLQLNGTLIVLSSKTVNEQTEYLFRVDNGQFVLFYWDIAKNALENGSAGVYEAVKTRIKKVQQLDVEDVEPFVSKDLMPYQVDGVNWFLKMWKRRKSGCVLGDDIGMGKSIQFLSFWDHLRGHTSWKGPCLILVNDVRNLRTWTEQIAVIGKSATIVYEGTTEECKVLRDWALTSRDSDGNIEEDYIPFELLLMTYDRFARDFEHLKHIPFQIVCCDNLIVVNVVNKLLSISNIPFKIVLFDNGFDAGFDRMQYILKFVQPDVDWKAVYDRRSRDVVLCRRRVDFAPRNIYRKDLVAFVAPTPWQSIFLRLNDLHRLRDLLTIDTEKDTWMSGDVMAKRICNHPYLLHGTESFLDTKMRAEKKHKLIGASSKFIFLDRVIPGCLQQGKPVIIMTQMHDLIQLLDEFCTNRDFSRLILTTATATEERQRIMYQFNSESPPDVLMSTVPLYSYEVISGRIMFVLDADWHPEEYIMPLCNFFAPSSDHEVITVIHVVNFGCYDHQEYIDRQRNRFLWQEAVSFCDVQNTVLNIPPDLMSIQGAPKNGISEGLEEVSQVVSSMDFMAIEQAMKDVKPPTEADDRRLLQYIGQFPNSRRKHRKSGHIGHFRDLSVAEFQLLIELVMRYGYGSWTEISRHCSIPCSQIGPYTRSLIVIACRYLPVVDVPAYPILIQTLINDIDNFTVAGLFCRDTASVSALNEYPELSEPTQKLKKHIHLLDRLDKYHFLIVLEMRLTYKCWENVFGRQNFLFSRLPPPRNYPIDRVAFESLSEAIDLDIDNPRVHDILGLMKYELILNNRSDGIACSFAWWTETEVEAVVHAIIRYGFTNLQSSEFHAKSGILSKDCDQVSEFAKGIQEVVSAGESCLVRLLRLDKAPELIQESTASWKGLTDSQVRDIKFHTRAMGHIHSLLATLPESPALELPIPWTTADFIRLLKKLAEYGLTALDSIFDDTTNRLPTRLNSDGQLLPCFASVHEFVWFLERLTSA